MPFTDAEVKRIKHELGQNTLNVGADAYIGVHQAVEVVVNSYIDAEVSTTSTTQVTASSPAVPATITLTSATGFSDGMRVMVDVDGRREWVTVQNLSGASLTALFTKNHGDSGGSAYPVYAEGSIPIVKDILAKIATAKDELASTFGEGALKKVDEIEFYQTGQTLFGATGDALRYWRDELSVALGIPNLWHRRQSAGSSVSVY